MHIDLKKFAFAALITLSVELLAAPVEAAEKQFTVKITGQSTTIRATVNSAKRVKFKKICGSKGSEKLAGESSVKSVKALVGNSFVAKATFKPNFCGTEESSYVRVMADDVITSEP